MMRHAPPLHLRATGLSHTTPFALAMVAQVFVSAAAFAGDGSSEATSKKSDWLSTSSGWETDSKFYAENTPPVGAWNFDYKHWFNAAAEPAWTTKSKNTKPGKANWDAKNFSDDQTTKGPGSTKTYAMSEWKVSPYKSSLFDRTSYYAKIQTRSQAYAKGPDTLANSKTRVDDPWVMLSPAANPDWVIDTNHMLDPSGKWTVGLDMAMFGTLNDRLPSSEVGASYSVDLTPASPTAAHSLVSMLDISIDGMSSHVTVGDSRVHLYLDGAEQTTHQVEAALNAYYSSGGWSANGGGFTTDSFRPDNASDLAQVFNLQAALFLDASALVATVYTSDWSYASAPAGAIPEPSTYSLLLAGLGIIAGVSRRRGLRRNDGG
jgi:hypothetical protein